MTAILRLTERRSNALFCLLACGGAIVVVRLGMGLTFFADEWAFIEGRSLWDPTTWWAPHNEHWSTLPVIAYGVILELVGLRSYLPYLIVLYGLHVLACAALFVLARRRVGALLGLGVASLVLLLGSGFENLYWGFQLGFVGSTAAGLWALVVLDEPPTKVRQLALLLLLVAGLASSGVGITFFIVAAIVWLLRDDWRGTWGALGIPAALFALWFLLAGRNGVGVYRSPLNLDTALALPGFVAGGFANAAGAILGVGPSLGLPVAAALLTVGAWRVLRHDRRRPILAMACACGIAFQYALIAAARAGVTEGQVAYSRYTYVGVFLLLVSVADLAGPIRLPQARAARLAVVCLLVASLELGLLWNVRLLVDGRDLFTARALTTRALVTVALDPAYANRVMDDRSLVLVRHHDPSE